jgi:hypothetical protein
VDDVPVPAKPYKFNFPEGHYVTAYAELGKMYPEADIEKEDFDMGYGVFCFDIQQTNFPLTIPPNKKANIKIEAEFTEALLENVVIMICGDFPNIISIDELRNVSM